MRAALTLVLVAASTAHVSVSTAANTQDCRPGPEAIVTKVPGGEWYRIGGFSGQEHTFICASAGGAAVEIGQPGNEMASSGGGLGPTVEHLVFAGLTAAVVYENETGSKGLDVVYLASGRVRFHRGLGGGKVEIPGEHSSAGSHSVGSMVVKADGSTAWTEQAKGSNYDVLEHETRTTVLDRSGQARPESLTLTGTTLRWRDRSGGRRTATLH